MSDTIQSAAGTSIKSNFDAKENERLAKLHPEKTVNGIYYEDNNELEAAKAEYEQRVVEESSSLQAKAEEAAQTAIDAEQVIQEALTGDNDADLLSGIVGGIPLNSVLGDATAVRTRQYMFDPSQYSYEYKTPNAGKPPNNLDPFPVDLKIEEFESHTPRIKIQKILTHRHGRAAARAALLIADAAEKRIVHLENNVATMMRLLFRLGARVPINCVYYGGQTTFEKYRCIRCLRDDRARDGGLFSIDQCCWCTRYEPIVGQCYEMEKGINT